MTGATCSTCLFWLATEPTGAGGICRRYPPLAEITWVRTNEKHETTASTTTSFFPPVQPSGWCGCHQERRGAPS